MLRAAPGLALLPAVWRGVSVSLSPSGDNFAILQSKGVFCPLKPLV